jgi:hypothetical protein
MIDVLKSIVNYEALGMIESFKGTCFGHAFSKACKHSTFNERVCKGIRYVSIKTFQIDLQKCITWPKKSRKCKLEWMKVCITIGFRIGKLNTLVKTRYQMKVSYSISKKISFTRF